MRSSSSEVGEGIVLVYIQNHIYKFQTSSDRQSTDVLES